MNIEHRVDTAISGNPYLKGRYIWVETEDGRVVLRGTVDTYFQKQMAQESLRHVEGVHQIDNQLEVVT
jgi:osmotically-inducible protein OsmY